MLFVLLFRHSTCQHLLTDHIKEENPEIPEGLHFFLVSSCLHLTLVILYK